MRYYLNCVSICLSNSVGLCRQFNSEVHRRSLDLASTPAVQPYLAEENDVPARGTVNFIHLIVFNFLQFCASRRGPDSGAIGGVLATVVVSPSYRTLACVPISYVADV